MLGEYQVISFVDGPFFSKMNFRVSKIAAQEDTVVFGSGGDVLTSEVLVILISDFLSFSNQDSQGVSRPANLVCQARFLLQ